MGYSERVRVSFNEKNKEEERMNELNLGIEGYIRKGHIVNVHFVKSQSIFNAEVLYVPDAEGENWRLKTKEGVVYVLMYERMDLIG